MKKRTAEYRVSVIVGFSIVVIAGVAIRVFAAPSVLQHDAWRWLSSIFAIINGFSFVSHIYFRKKYSASKDKKPIKNSDSS